MQGASIWATCPFHTTLSTSTITRVSDLTVETGAKVRTQRKQSTSDSQSHGRSTAVLSSLQAEKYSYTADLSRVTAYAAHRNKHTKCGIIYQVL